MNGTKSYDEYVKEAEDLYKTEKEQYRQFKLHVAATLFNKVFPYENFYKAKRHSRMHQGFMELAEEMIECNKFYVRDILGIKLVSKPTLKNVNDKF